MWEFPLRMAWAQASEYVPAWLLVMSMAWCLQLNVVSILRCGAITMPKTVVSCITLCSSPFLPQVSPFYFLPTWTARLQ